jgi:hypothetical protein
MVASSVLSFTICSTEIRFSVTPSTFGLLQETLLIKNESSSDQQLEFTIRLFVDEGALQTDLDKTSSDNKIQFKACRALALT